mgnify:CR=1 FL=1
MKYTKGGWIQIGNFIFSSEKPPRLIAEISSSNFGLKEQLANAHLIAAAPDMYEACLQMQEFISTWKDVLLTNMTRGILMGETGKLLTAIAKAEGKGEGG